MTHPIFVALLVLLQTLCAVFFISDMVMTTLGVETTPLQWQVRELVEVGASVGLILGVVLGAIALTRTMRRTAHVEGKLRALSSAFHDMMEERFTKWGLTPAERDVAHFAVKGLSTQEIAALRATSEGTVKAQTNAIYRKAGVNGRSQLLSLFIEDLMTEPTPKSDVEAVPVQDVA